MIRRVVRFLGSSVLATWLLIVVGVYSAIATFVPQGSPSDPAVAAWASRPVVGPISGFLGMNHAFTSVAFLACVSLLAASAIVCSWQRTKVALSRSQVLRNANGMDSVALSDDHDIEIPVGPEFGASDVLSRASEVLESLDVRAKGREGVLYAVSSRWAVWGSPVFHWALVALVLVLVAGPLLRATGRLGLAVGQTKPHAQSSYGVLDSGSLHAWDRTPVAFRLERFEADFTAGGINRGPTPTVAVLDSAGAVVKTQRVYPNSPLKSGPITVHSEDYGLSARISVLDPAGAPKASTTQLVDFSTEDPLGTVPVGYFTLSGDGGNKVNVSVTIPLDVVQGQINYWMPQRPTARLLVTSADKQIVADQVLAPGQDLELPIGRTLRLENVDWYARVSVVDDWTIPLVYVLMSIAMAGLMASLLMRQQLVVAALVETPSGPVLAMKVRLWRNVPCTRDEIAEALGQALGTDGREKS